MPKATYLHKELADRLDSECTGMRRSTRGGTADDLRKQRDASRWFIEALYQGYCCLPRLPIALPRSRNAYANGLPFGYEVVKRVLDAAVRLGFVIMKKGRHDPDGINWVTRVHPHGDLINHFKNIGTVWQKLPPPDKLATIFVNQGKNCPRRIATEADHSDVLRMQRNLYEINLFLAKQCIQVFLPNARFKEPAEKFLKDDDDLSVASSRDRSSAATWINFQNVFLRRIFTENAFATKRLQGGRFYGGWWQNLRKELRPYILINGSATGECDFSGMAISCLYAMEGKDIGPTDPYEIGLQYKKGDPRRDLVKNYIVAILNDSTGRFRLGTEELSVLGIDHQTLHSMVEQRHRDIRHHFKSGIGLYLQYIDSVVAERVVLHFVRKNEVCLPIHDSFVVRNGLLMNVEKVMKEEYRRTLGHGVETKSSTVNMTFDFSHDPTELSPTQGSMIRHVQRITQLMQQYSASIGYLTSWESQTFTPEEIGYRARVEEIAYNVKMGK